MKLIKDIITLDELKETAVETFGDFVKAVVDVDQEIMVIGGELHSDEEAFLLNLGSHQENLWGINLYPVARTVEWIEFDSLINIRPSQNNRSRNVENEATRVKIINIVNKLVSR